jgi:hypothetical protein
MMSTVALAPIELPAPDDDAPVLLARPVHGDPESLPRYGDDTWNLQALHPTPDTRAQFRSIFPFGRWFRDERFRALAKEYAYARLNARPPATVARLPGLVRRRRRPMPLTVHDELGRLRMVCDWLSAATPPVRFADLTEERLDALRCAMRDTLGASDVALTQIADVIKKLYDYRDYLRSDHLAFEPWPGLSAAKVGGRIMPAENTTPRVPEEVMGPFLRWCLFYVEVAAKDILTAAEAKAHSLRHHRGRFCWDAFAAHPATGRPWRPAIESGWEVRNELDHLRAACYVVVGYLSGMRHQEMNDLEAGCVRRRRGPGGRVIRRYIRGQTCKGKRSPVEAEWVVVEPVAAAVEILERLSTSGRLFEPGAWGARRAAGRRIRSDWWSQKINLLCAHMSALGQEHGHDVIPLVDGRPWRFTTRQFRRTLAWHIAAQPGGTVAGMLQYKHVSTLTFEGYAGTSRSGFRQEVEQERMLSQLGALCEQWRSWEQGHFKPTGSGGKRVERLFRRVRRELVGFDGAVVDDDRLALALRDEAQRVYPGVLTNCWFDPATAKCLSDSQRREAKAPNMPGCDPTRCANSCPGQQHRPVWERLRAEREAMLATPGLSPLQIQIIEQDWDVCETVIADIDRSVATPADLIEREMA